MMSEEAASEFLFWTELRQTQENWDQLGGLARLDPAATRLTIVA
jgi:hypothetical protein